MTPLNASGRASPGHLGVAPLSAIALLVAVALAISPLASGYYNFTTWGPLALGGVVLLVGLALAARPAFTRIGLTAAAGIGGLLGLSFASMLWAASRDSAWTDSNRLALYCVIFAIGLLAIRERRGGRTVIVILGVPALLTSAVIAARLVAGSGQSAFLLGRLDSPIGYVNGTAGLLVMGLWPFIALAETGERRAIRAFGSGAAAMIAATAVLTQSRAIVPAIMLATVLVLAAIPRRARRGANLAIAALSMAAGLHWTLAVYRSTGPSQSLAIPTHVLRGAGLAILLSAALGFALKLLVSTLGAGVGPEIRARWERHLGRALLAGTTVGIVAVAAAGHTTIANQWDAFTQLNPEQSAPNRFLDAGGFRYDLWRIAVDEFRAHPLGGVGAGSYDSDYYRLRRNPQSVIQPHSLELQMAAELGIFGLLALLTFCGAVLIAGIRGRPETLSGSDPLIRIGALGIFSAWLAATSVDWLYDIPGIAGMAILAAAALVVPAPAADPAGAWAPRAHLDPVRRRRLQAGIVVTLGVLALVAAGIGRQYAAALYARSGTGKLASSPAQAISTLETAESLDPYSLSTLYAIASAYARLDDYPAARDAVLKAERLEPQNYVPPALLGDLAYRRGDYGVALASYERALSLDPREAALQTALQETRQALR